MPWSIAFRDDLRLCSKTVRWAVCLLLPDREVAHRRVLFATQRRARVGVDQIRVGVEVRRVEGEPPARRGKLAAVQRHGGCIAETQLGIAQVDAVLAWAEIQLHAMDARASDALAASGVPVERVAGDV